MSVSLDEDQMTSSYGNFLSLIYECFGIDRCSSPIILSLDHLGVLDVDGMSDHVAYFLVLIIHCIITVSSVKCYHQF